MKINLRKPKMKAFLFALIVLSLLLFQPAYCADMPEEIRSGQVIDVVTGNPIEGAVVLFMTGRDPCEALTDKQGKYLIKGQFYDEDEVFIYKQSYIVYRVYDSQTMPFLTYTPNLTQEYRPVDNIVKLEPMVPEISHREHMQMFTMAGIGSRTPLFEMALESERAQAKQEKDDTFQMDYSIERLLNLYRLEREKKISEQKYNENLKFIDYPQLQQLIQSFQEEYKQEALMAALVAFAKQNVYRDISSKAIYGIASIFDRKDITDKVHSVHSVPQRLQIIKELEGLWQRTRGRSKAEVLYDTALYAQSPDVRWKALNQIKQSKDANAVLCLLQCIQNDTPNNSCTEALSALASIGDKSAIPQIKKMLLSSNVYIRREAALTLHALGDSTGVPCMIAALSSPNKNTRSVANAVLPTITDANFCNGKSFRQLSPEEQKAVIEKWNKWWTENKKSFDVAQFSEYTRIAAADKSFILMTQAKELTGLENFGTKDNSPLKVFENFKAALMAEDVDKAVQCISSIKQEQYKEIFQQNKAHLREMGEHLGPLKLEEKLSGMLMCEMPTEEDDGIFSWPVHFSQDFDGQWKIETF